MVPKANNMEISIHNRLEEMSTIVAMVEQFGAKYAISNLVLNDLNLVLDEVVSNIISYGYSDGTAGHIKIRLTYQSQEISAEIQDDGIPFDPLAAAPIDTTGSLQSRRIGGLGIRFMKELMDKVTYARVGNENRLILIKKMPV